MVGGLLAYYIIMYVMAPSDNNGILDVFPLKKFLAQLTMTINLLPEPHKLILPGPYWYFGMTMQLYVIYLLFVYKRPTTWIILTAAGILVVSLFMEPYPLLLIWIKINAIGWLLPFSYGILLGRNNDNKVFSCHAIILTFGALIATALMSLTYYTWLLVPLSIAMLAVSVVSIIPNILSNTFDFVGKISMYAFVIHPIVRELSFLYDLNPYWGIIIYMTITLILSYAIERIISMRHTLNS